MNGGPQPPAKRKKGGHGPTLEDEAVFYFPPANSDGGRGRRRAGGLRKARRRHEPAYGSDTAGPLNRIPTPVVADARGTRNFTARRKPGSVFNPSKTLTDFAWTLPTPKASDGPHGGPNQRDRSGSYYLPGLAPRRDAEWVSVDGIDYAPAIRRWEAITGRRAPEPTEAGTRGNRRIRPAFAEWMMGLAFGHITGRNLRRSDELQIIGNGVVPQQAEHAYRFLLGPGWDPGQRRILAPKSWS